MSALIFDLETTIHTEFKRKASPFCEDNYVVAAGYKLVGQKRGPFGYYFLSPEGYKKSVMPLEGVTLLVGFNIKFDLLYSWDKPELTEFFKRGGRIWDCQYVEYLLEGMQPEYQMCSMDQIIEKYGGTLKDDTIKELWKKGVNTENIDKDLLMDYLLGNNDPENPLDGDIGNTYRIFMGQVERVRKIHPNFLKMVWNRMDGLLATTEMEWNGIYIDRERGERDRAVLVDKLNALEEELVEFIPDLPKEIEFNWRSNHHRSCLIFGGTLGYKRTVQKTDEEGNPEYKTKTEEWPLFNSEACDPKYCRELPKSEHCEFFGYIRNDGVLQDTFKSGKRKGEPKFRKVKVPDLDSPKTYKESFKFTLDGYLKPKEEWASSQLDAAGKCIYSTSSEVISELSLKYRNIPFLSVLSERASIAKDLSSYYWTEDDNGKARGMLTLVTPDSFIHHKLNHTSTVTSRLSSSDPRWGSLNSVNSGELLIN